MSWPLASIGSEIDVSRVSAIQIPAFYSPAALAAGSWLWRADTIRRVGVRPGELIGNFTSASVSGPLISGYSAGAPGYRSSASFTGALSSLTSFDHLDCFFWLVVPSWVTNSFSVANSNQLQTISLTVGLQGSPLAPRVVLSSSSETASSTPYGASDWIFVGLFFSGTFSRAVALGPGGNWQILQGSGINAGGRIFASPHSAAAAGLVVRSPGPSGNPVESEAWSDSGRLSPLANLATWALAGMPTFPRLAPRRTSAILFPGSPGVPVEYANASATVTSLASATAAGTRMALASASANGSATVSLFVDDGMTKFSCSADGLALAEMVATDGVSPFSGGSASDSVVVANATARGLASGGASGTATVSTPAIPSIASARATAIGITTASVSMGLIWDSGGSASAGSLGDSRIRGVAASSGSANGIASGESAASGSARTRGNASASVVATAFLGRLLKMSAEANASTFASSFARGSVAGSGSASSQAAATATPRGLANGRGSSAGLGSVAGSFGAFGNSRISAFSLANTSGRMFGTVRGQSSILSDSSANLRARGTVRGSGSASGLATPLASPVASARSRGSSNGLGTALAGGNGSAHASGLANASSDSMVSTVSLAQFSPFASGVSATQPIGAFGAGSAILRADSVAVATISPVATALVGGRSASRSRGLIGRFPPGSLRYFTRIYTSRTIRKR